MRRSNASTRNSKRLHEFPRFLLALLSLLILCVGRTTMKSSRLLITVGWLTYSISYFVQVHVDGHTIADGTLPGLEAILIALAPMFERGYDVSLLGVISVLSALTNFLVISSPFVFLRGSARQNQGLGLALLLAIAINSFWCVLYQVTDLRIGYFLWSLSFLMLAIGFLLQGRSPRADQSSLHLEAA